ncbi:hypothetical protein [Maribacter aestuarii]|uniref:hypothetical protein n=1 Tax=Maribacter aestuarii TaxID=1130723 RepID=UPI0025A6332F|nr:hypothetical protein [Maribacter aestuarii]
MGQDLRKLFEKEREERKYELKPGHEERFLQRLDNTLPQRKKSSLPLLKIAASILLVATLGFLGYQGLTKEETIPTIIVDTHRESSKEESFSFGDLSPDLRKVENFYVANINMELSRLEVSGENKDLVDSFMERLSELNQEYKDLNKELNELGPNDQTIAALIQNLQLRLELLQKLKKKLNQLKSSKNEQITENSI